jgi:hypothetical protein
MPPKWLVGRHPEAVNSRGPAAPAWSIHVD